MKYALVLLVSLLAGGAVYALTLRNAPGGGAIDLGFGADLLRRRTRPRADRDEPAPVATPGDVVVAEDLDTSPERAGEGLTYLRVLTQPPSWTERLQGLLGVIVLVVFSALFLAGAVYGVGHVVNSTLSHFLSPH